MLTLVLQSSTWTSAGGANPVDNFIKEVRGITTPDFEELIKEITQGEITKEFQEDPTESENGLTILDRLESDVGKNPTKAFDIAGLQIGVGPAEMGQIVNFAKNPSTMLVGVLKGAPMLAALGPIIVAAIAAPAVLALFVELLTMPGGPLDKRLKIDFEQGMNAFLSRQDQRRRQIGLDQVVITQFRGFGNMGGQLTTNTLTRVKAVGISKLGINEKALGIVP